MEENVAPDPSVAFACFISSCWWLPSGMFFLGLNVLEDLLLNKKLILLDLKIQNCISRVVRPPTLFIHESSPLLVSQIKSRGYFKSCVRFTTICSLSCWLLRSRWQTSSATSPSSAPCSRPRCRGWAPGSAPWSPLDTGTRGTQHCRMSELDPPAMKENIITVAIQLWIKSVFHLSSLS